MKKTNINGIKVNWLYLPYSNHMNFISRINAFIIFAFYSSIKVMSIKGDIIYASSTPLTIGIPALLGSYLKKFH